MFYVYRNTTKDSAAIAQFEDKDEALEMMERLATREFREGVTGYAVRDYQLKTYAEMEI